jgi:DNA-binding NtrC family response regulator
MNSHNVIADSDRSAIVQQTNANRAGSSVCEDAQPVEPSAAQGEPRRDEPDGSDKWLTIERSASDPGHASPSAKPGAAKTGARPGKASATVTVAQGRAETPWPLTLDEIIKQTLVRLLRETGGNRRRTASLLGISRSTLYRMLARYDIDRVGRTALSPRSRIGPPVSPA